MATKLFASPVLEPLTLTETKDHMRVTAASEDALISELIPAARRHAESYTRRALMTQTWDLLLDRFADPGRWISPIEIPLPPLQSIDSINYVDSAGDSQLLDPAKYQVDIASEPGRVAPAYGETWPDTREQLNAVTIRFVAGYGDNPADVPGGIRQAMLMLIGHLFERRESTITGTIISTVPLSTQYLLDSYRIMKNVC